MIFAILRNVGRNPSHLRRSQPTIAWFSNSSCTQNEQKVIDIEDLQNVLRSVNKYQDLSKSG
jgi:hypothetical protein